MKRKDILQKIVDENGSCEWTFLEYPGQDICRMCPFIKLKQKDKHGFFCCYEAINGENHPLSEEEIDAKYKAMAMKLLMDVLFEEMLLDDGELDLESEFDE